MPTRSTPWSPKVNQDIFSFTHIIRQELHVASIVFHFSIRETFANLYLGIHFLPFLLLFTLFRSHFIFKFRLHSELCLVLLFHNISHQIILWKHRRSFFHQNLHIIKRHHHTSNGEKIYTHYTILIILYTMWYWIHLCKKILLYFIISCSKYSIIHHLISKFFRFHSWCFQHIIHY